MVPWRLIDRIGDLVHVLGTRRFGTEFFDLFSGALDLDECSVFAFRGTEPPSPVILESRSDEMRECASRLAGAYVAGAFTRDPNLPKGKLPVVPAVWTMRAADFTDADYRSQFYDEPRIAHELVVLGHAHDTLYYLSFYRRDRQAAFRKTELNCANRLAQVAIKLIHKHRDVFSNSETRARAVRPLVAAHIPDGNRVQLLAHLSDVLLAEPGRLSAREAQVCAGIILGYTMAGIGLNFGISLNTVATHRKRAYGKLGICSQNELFSRYFQTVNRHLAASAA